MTADSDLLAIAVRMPTAPGPPLRDTARSRAHAFFWIVLFAAATVSVAGNATHALLNVHVVPAVAASVAIVPPVALLTAVHGVTVLSRAHAQPSPPPASR
ncbi:hypothetical protein [Nocardia sp. NPDC051981]|uniref:hypothetical protein n=1 Tax=Nocardia sp. NPDC051981 TaxID=3155417 RepID=UPI003419513E